MCCSFYYDICPWFNPVQLDILTSNSKKESAHWAVDVMAQMYACWLSGWLRCNFWTVFILSGRLYINIWPIEYYKEPPWDRSSLSWLWALQWNEEIHKAVWDEDKQWTGLSFLRVHERWHHGFIICQKKQFFGLYSRKSPSQYWTLATSVAQSYIEMW